jgi:hypothetical protein
MVLVVASPISFLAKLVAYPLAFLCRLLTWSADIIASPSYLLSLDYYFLYFVCALAIALTIFLIFKRKRVSTIAVFCMVMAIVMVSNAVSGKALEREKGLGYYSQGNNDAIYVKSGASTLIIDNSSGGYSFVRDVAEISKARNYSRVTLFLTHYHVYMAYGVSRLAHYGRLDALILSTPSENEINAYNAVVRAADHYLLDVKEYSATNDVIDYNGVAVCVYSAKPTNSTHSAVAMIVKFEDRTFVYHGNKIDGCVDLNDFPDAMHIYGVHSSKVEDKSTRSHVYYKIKSE